MIRNLLSKRGRGRPSTNPGKLMSFRVMPDLQAWLDAQGIKSEYINGLIRKDMEARTENGYGKNKQ